MIVLDDDMILDQVLKETLRWYPILSVLSGAVVSGDQECGGTRSCHDPAEYQIHAVPESSSKKDPHVISIPVYYTLLCPLRSGCTRRSAM